MSDNRIADGCLCCRYNRHLVFEVAVGINGCVWLRAPGGNLEMVLIRNAILNSETLDDVQIEAMVEQLVAMASKMAKHRKS